MAEYISIWKLIISKVLYKCLDKAELITGNFFFKLAQRVSNVYIS